MKNRINKIVLLQGKRSVWFSLFIALVFVAAIAAYLPMDEAIQEIKRNAGTQFDPYIARLFVKII